MIALIVSVGGTSDHHRRIFFVVTAAGAERDDTQSQAAGEGRSACGAGSHDFASGSALELDFVERDAIRIDLEAADALLELLRQLLQPLALAHRAFAGADGTSPAMRCTASMLRAISSDTIACSCTADAVSSTTLISVLRSASVVSTRSVPSSTSRVPSCIDAHRLVGLLADRRDQILDVSRALADALGERPDLVGDDREAAALLAGVRRLDRRVERQHRGLLADLPDHLDDVADALAALAEHADRLGRVLDRLADLLQALRSLASPLPRLLGGRLAGAAFSATCWIDDDSSVTAGGRALILPACSLAPSCIWRLMLEISPLDALTWKAERWTAGRQAVNLGEDAVQVAREHAELVAASGPPAAWTVALAARSSPVATM